MFCVQEITIAQLGVHMFPELLNCYYGLDGPLIEAEHSFTLETLTEIMKWVIQTKNSFLVLFRAFRVK
jgi:hypothetical protein